MSRALWLRLPDGATLRAVLGWCLLVDLLFFPIYGGVNWLTGLRPRLLDLYLPEELAIPLVPQAIWVYLSLLLLFCLPIFTLPRQRAREEALAAIVGLLASAAMWLLLPARLGFQRVLPAGYESVFALVFALDTPHNLVPSLHVVFSTLAVLACGQTAPTRMRLWLWIWLAAISLSTVLTHQHHLLDVASGLVVAAVCRALVLRGLMRLRFSSTPFLARERVG